MDQDIAHGGHILPGLQCLRPHRGVMDYPENIDCPCLFGVWEDIGKTGDYEFAGGGHSTRAAEARLGGQQLGGGPDLLGGALGGGWIVFGNILDSGIEIKQGTASPFNLH